MPRHCFAMHAAARLKAWAIHFVSLAALGCRTQVTVPDSDDLSADPLASRLRTEGSRVRTRRWATPRVAHERAAIDGADPTEEGSAFDALYEPDGSHPSAQRAYLAASVLLATITGQDPRAFTDPKRSTRRWSCATQPVQRFTTQHGPRSCAGLRLARWCLCARSSLPSAARLA